ncbi:cystathionine beta-lyase [Rhizobium sullae]|uniref:cystathionine beta-lyase n=1 Tax=Rhizobium sullae TaxID=50338 RepID=UPI000B35A2FC|nr:cystathionine beta-lyase [Rhizobium sullae]
MHDDTRCLQTNDATAPLGFQSLSFPVFRGSTVVFPTVDAYQRRRETFYDGYSYGLYGTPTSRTLEARIASLECGTYSHVVPSGLAAIVLTILAVAKAGDQVLLPDSVYDPVRTLSDNFLSFLGIEVGYYDPLIGGGIAALLNDRVRLVLVESPGSATMEIQDMAAIVKAARASGSLVAADNTWATPLRLKPLAMGIDFSICALSKYLSGHSDVLMGSVAVRDETLYRRLRDVSRYLGYGVSPEDCSLVMRGIETLPIRLDRAEANALAIAKWLQERPEVLSVLHPALPSHPGHELWQRDFLGSSGLFSVVLQSWTRPRVASAIESLEFFSIGASWGGTKSIVAVIDPQPVRTTTRTDIQGPLIRFSIGLEHVDDLLADLEKSFRILAAEMVEPSMPTRWEI